MTTSALSRRHFLKVVAGSIVLSQVPTLARAANRLPFEFNFPQDPLLTWFEPTYGAVRTDGRRHLGIDLMAPKLSPVYAVTEGVVTRIANSPRAGRYLMIEHSEGWQSWYLHLNNDSAGRDNGRAAWDQTVVDGLEEGDRVEAGMHIAFVGDSGNAEGTGSHTHFELHLGSRTVDPWPHLVTGQQMALDQMQAERVAPLVASTCNLRQGILAIDAEVCADDFEYLGARPAAHFSRLPISLE